MITQKEIIKLIEDGQEGPTIDFKEDLSLASEMDKAEFVKDVLTLANSPGIAHLIIGIEDGTCKPVGIKTSYTPEKLNQILKDKCDPPLRVEYAEKEILHHKIGVIEIRGDNPPYIVAVPDRYGGIIERGTVFIRNFNINQGASREDLDRIYSAKYATPQADLQLRHEILNKTIDDLMEVTINFSVFNAGASPATDPFIYIQFTNIREIFKCTGDWVNVTHVNNNIPTINLSFNKPIYCSILYHCHGTTVRVSQDTKQIHAKTDIQAVGMSRKRGEYYINLES